MVAPHEALALMMHGSQAALPRPHAGDGIDTSAAHCLNGACQHDNLASSGALRRFSQIKVGCQRRRVEAKEQALMRCSRVDHCGTVAQHSGSAPQKGTVQLDAKISITTAAFNASLVLAPSLAPSISAAIHMRIADWLADQGSVAICLCSAWRLLC